MSKCLAAIQKNLSLSDGTIFVRAGAIYPLTAGHESALAVSVPVPFWLLFFPPNEENKTNKMFSFAEKFALLETHYLIARVVQTFSKMEATDNKEWVELYALATTCKDGVNVRMTRG